MLDIVICFYFKKFGSFCLYLRLNEPWFFWKQSSLAFSFFVIFPDGYLLLGCWMWDMRNWGVMAIENDGHVWQWNEI
jgi:hypothetical protein